MNPLSFIVGLVAFLSKAGDAPKFAAHQSKQVAKQTSQGAHQSAAHGAVARQPRQAEFTWKQYELYAGFYKFFLDFGLKANVFFYGITGAILTILYNPNNSQTGAVNDIGARLPPPVLRILLWTPLLISIVLAGAFIVGAVFWWMIARQVNQGLREREVQYKVKPYLHYLTGLLLLFGGIYVFVAIWLYDIVKWHRNLR